MPILIKNWQIYICGLIFSLVDESEIQKSFYQGASCIFLVFDIVKGFSFDKVENQLKTISENCKKSIEIALIGNKSDLITD